MMRMRVLSLRQAKEELKDKHSEDVKLIIISSYQNDIECIRKEDKIILSFEDTTIRSEKSFNSYMAKQIHEFVENIDFEKYELYVCCDSGISRSSAIAAAILRKHGEDEDIIWKNCNYHPNLLVYEELCKEFGLSNSKVDLKRKEKVNANALKMQINKARNLNKNIFARLFKM